MKPLPRQNEPQKYFHVTYGKGNEGTSIGWLKRKEGAGLGGGFENQK